MKWRGISEKQYEAFAGSLNEKLIEIEANSRQYVRPENQKTTDDFVLWLSASENPAQALREGATAPSFVLADQNGKSVNSDELLARSPLVIVFFRGRWCPYCVTTLEAWNSALPKLREAGTSLVGISPQTPKHNSLTADQHKLALPLLSDAGNQVARQFGLTYKLPDEMQSLYSRSFVNLPLVNGDQSWELPMPATYVIGSDGKVLFGDVSPDFRRRAEPEQVMAFLTGR